MLDCIILGDSIAVGTHSVKTECVEYAKSGWTTWQWNQKFIDREHKDLTAHTVVISLGTNDYKGIKTYDELRKMRSAVKADRVFWIMPPCNEKFCKPDINYIVQTIAGNFGDKLITTHKLQNDRIHPSWAGYKELSEEIR